MVQQDEVINKIKKIKTYVDDKISTFTIKSDFDTSISDIQEALATLNKELKEEMFRHTVTQRRLTDTNRNLELKLSKKEFETEANKIWTHIDQF